MNPSLPRSRRWLDRLLHRGEERAEQSSQARLAQVNALAGEMGTLDEAGLRAAATRVRALARDGRPRDELLPWSFALVREVSRRVLGLRPFDEQVLAGIAMHDCLLVEQPTGEGKTLAAVMPAYLEALYGEGLHILTFNDYLARRDAAWMGPIFEFLGVSVGCVHGASDVGERRRAYRCDVTYVTAKEVGFDLLRDQLCWDPEQTVHRPLHCCIVDEADSILIDEARVPLVIAGQAEPSVLHPHRARDIVATLDAEQDFDTDRHEHRVALTDRGVDRVEEALGSGSLHAKENFRHLAGIELALQARVLLHRDVHYIVREGRIEIVDEFTGRVVQDRRWPDGLQAAVEAKEGLEPEREGEVLGAITIQHMLELYPRRAGMTATALPAATELLAFYGLRVAAIPPHRPCIREDLPDLVFRTKARKLDALCEEIRTVHAQGRPILVGTATVRESEELAATLRATGLTPRVLNAKNDEVEAAIVARAGERDAITIATNMAGRGTDIRLGGPDEEGREDVAARGGLYVMGTNRHESRRIDDQLRGRAGRQGDPGSSRFFVSLEDDLFVRYGISAFLPELPADPGGEVVDPLVHSEIERAQRIIEGETCEIRRTLRRYSHLVEQHRRLFQERREGVLLAPSPRHFLPAGFEARLAVLEEILETPVLEEVVRRISLAAMDRGWVKHLARAAHLRAGIHLFGMVRGSGGLGTSSLFGLGGPSPLDEFQLRANDSFARMKQEVEASIARALATAEITRDGIELDEAGLRGPSSTWTYLIQENPLGDALERLVAGVLRALRERS